VADHLVVVVRSAADFEAALALRIAVFVDEQGVDPQSERDAIDDDPSTLHLLARAAEGGVVATGRLVAPFRDTMHGAEVGLGALDPAVPHIGRVAVAKAARGAGAGRLIMTALEQEALQRYGVDGVVRVELSAQAQALPFYERLGYTPHGNSYLDEGIPHLDAFKLLSS
jgi:predicted GNAT family N-acyltransferase